MTFIIEAFIIIFALACAAPILFGVWALISAPFFWLAGKALEHKWITLGVLLICYLFMR